MTITIPGYHFQEEPIYNGQRFVIFSGISTQNNEPIVIKMLKATHPTPEDIRKFKREYEITKILDSDKTVHVVGFEKYQDSYGMVLENIILPTLAEELQKRNKFKIRDSLEMGIKIAKAVLYIHKKNIIHKDLNPSNIFCDFDRRVVKIFDFNLATTLPKEQAAIVNPNVLEGTLPYISPEQTGRMNRGIDYRTDFYSLGIVYYQMLTGQLPFHAKDPIELVYNHIAILPKTPSEINPEIPAMLSTIVMKLIKKNPEERYQNIQALLEDLTHCLEEWDKNGKIQEFQLSKKDIYYRFQIQDKLYGRDDEIKKLLDVYNKVTGSGVELILVTGEPGIGKSVLINELQKPVIEKHGFYISGKFEQFKHNVPYAALIQAFTELVNQLLTEDETKIAFFRKKILDSVKGYGEVIVNVIPNLQTIIGKQPPLLGLSPTELENQFFYVFQNFIRAISTQEHPLVIFLDDLQWADVSSLKMIESLLTSPDCHYLYMIGAYRSNEVNELHPVSMAIQNLNKQNIIAGNISLQALTPAFIMDLLADNLHREKDDVYPLADVCFEKTGGNPFFLINLLKNLHKEGLIKFDDEKSRWEWDLQLIKQKSISENIIQLMSDRILALHPVTQKALQLASCIGNPFNLEILSNIAEVLLPNESENILNNLVPALEDGLIYTYGNTAEVTNYQFAHDRVQQAVYALITDKERQTIHIKIARYLLKTLTENNLNEIIFNIVDHYNLTLPYDYDAVEKNKIAEFNLKAAKFAKSAAAFEAALEYVKMAMKFVDQEIWKTNYTFMLDLYTEAVDNAFLVRKYDEMENFTEVGLANAKNVLDEVNFLKIKVLAEASQNKQRQSVETAVSTLARLGVKLPKHPTKLSVLLDILKVKLLVNKVGIQNITKLPQMTDPVKKAVVDMITISFPCAYQSYPEMFPLLVCTNVSLSLRYGNTEGSPYSYCIYGIISIGFLGEIEKGFEFGEAGIQLMELLHDTQGKTKIAFAHYGGIKHWKDSIYTCMPKLVENFETGLSYGDLEYACYSIHIYISQAFHSGIPLPELLMQTADYQKRVKKIKHRSIFTYISVFHQSIVNFIEMREDPDVLVGQFFDENVMIPMCVAASDLAALYNTYYCKLELAYYFGRYDKGMEYIAHCDKYIHVVYSLFGVPAFYFYKALTMLAIYESSCRGEKRHILKTVKQCLTKLKKWSKYAPSNHLQKYLLVKAELKRVLNSNEEARTLYDQAIMAAKENQFFNEEAITNELAAKFYLKQGSQKIAKLYMEEAYHSYQMWGAKAKILQLETQYPEILRDIMHAIPIVSLEELSMSATESKVYTSEILDLVTIQKTVRIITSTIGLEDLLKTLMHILIVNAGAQKCMLLLEKEGNFYVEAASMVGATEDKILQSINMSDESIPVSLVYYVIRTKETIVLDNATYIGAFVANPYIVKNQCKSILCMPLFHQGALIGVLYLENNVTKSAFTTTRVDFLKLLSSQIAISIDNAKAYAKIIRLNKDLIVLNKVYEKFIPKEYLNLLEKKSIIDINLGDSVQKEMTVLFSDIRNFTTRSEAMLANESFVFINSFFNVVGPLVRRHNGFIDKYIGDSIMAIFPGSADDAVCCAIEMQRLIGEYNLAHDESIKIGVGINSGTVQLGVVGEEHRMNATVISNAVNIASRVESLTKEVAAPILITKTTYAKLKNPAKYTIQLVDTVSLKGIKNPETIYAIYGVKV